MNALISTPLFNLRVSKYSSTTILHCGSIRPKSRYEPIKLRANSNEVIDTKTAEEPEQELQEDQETRTSTTKASIVPNVDKDLKKVGIRLLFFFFYRL
ncbi:hypothetical protein U1Q18_034183 [Sarracenia purpurea var. burkii]